VQVVEVFWMPKSRGGEGIREGFKGCFRFGHAVGGQAIRVSVFSFSPCTALFLRYLLAELGDFI